MKTNEKIRQMIANEMVGKDDIFSMLDRKDKRTRRELDAGAISQEAADAIWGFIETLKDSFEI